MGGLADAGLAGRWAMASAIHAARLTSDDWPMAVIGGGLADSLHGRRHDRNKALDAARRFWPNAAGLIALQ